VEWGGVEGRSEARRSGTGWRGGVKRGGVGLDRSGVDGCST
jgi:hypothetical protein